MRNPLKSFTPYSYYVKFWANGNANRRIFYGKNGPDPNPGNWAREILKLPELPSVRQVLLGIRQTPREVLMQWPWGRRWVGR